MADKKSSSGAKGAAGKTEAAKEGGAKGGKSSKK